MTFISYARRDYPYGETDPYGNKNSWYYVDDATGEKKINSWVQEGGVWFFVDGTGMIVTSDWLKDTDGSWYFLSAKENSGDNAGTPLKGSYNVPERIGYYDATSASYVYENVKGGTFTFDDSGKWVQSANSGDGSSGSSKLSLSHNNDGKWVGSNSHYKYFLGKKREYYNADDDTSDYEDYQEGDEYDMDSDFEVIELYAEESWVFDNGSWYYVDSTGVRVEHEWIKDGDNYYYADRGGKIQTGQKYFSLTSDFIYIIGGQTWTWKDAPCGLITFDENGKYISHDPNGRDPQKVLADVSIGDTVKVLGVGEYFLGNVLEVSGEQALVSWITARSSVTGLSTEYNDHWWTEQATGCVLYTSSWVSLYDITKY